MVVLDACSSPVLDRYFERIQQLQADYGKLAGQDLWWILCLADTRMRGERFEKIRRSLDEELSRLTALGRAAEARLVTTRPWEAVFLAAAEDDQWWDQQVREKVVLFSTALKGRPELVDEGHHAILAPGGAASASGGAPKKLDKVAQPGKRERQREAARKRAEEARKEKAKRDRTPPRRTPPRERSPLKKPGGKGAGKGKAGQDCWRWTRDAEGCTGPCPTGRRHPVCRLCRKSHPWQHRCPT